MKRYDSRDFNFLYKDTTRANRYYSINLNDERKAEKAKKHVDREINFDAGRRDALYFNVANYETKDREYARGYMTVINLYNRFIEEEYNFDDNNEAKFYTFNLVFSERFLLDKCSQKERRMIEYRLGYNCGILGYELNSLEKLDSVLDNLAKSSDNFKVGYAKGLFSLGYLNGLLRGNINFVFDQENHPSDWLRNNENFCEGIDYANSNVTFKNIRRSR